MAHGILLTTAARRRHCGCPRCPTPATFLAVPYNNTIVFDRNMGLLKHFTVILVYTLYNSFNHIPWSPGQAGLVRYIYIFGGSCPLMEFCQVQNSLYVQVLRSPILTALLHGTRVVGVSQTLRRATRNGITNFRRGRHLGGAAITLGIGPHSSCRSFT